ncbi:bifunctional DNA-formamidopyrimidine glycosylase/DNA-(apurinic or apyrimidinic site) lyase [uncultured Psychromonas sp.]|uniref:bifunctional DNA-formamidopyrimidine glycosylase/DNA-(apurinic or apyrimidinic site) lyase n=1 Tax=uncultured Psychromonas sp. TaxID=173974 RepID=UPI002612D002|nr:bifunctional DNA-formamidopyrimidine glycosylase/DNA-(apurinic or apyrimidinic site) lyase [uncultured Psychromonas sp.]
MPELPEVETSRRGISPHIVDQKISGVVLRHHQLRWPIPSNLLTLLKNRVLLAVDRRAKYLLLRFENGTLLIHLGMSGSLRICELGDSPQKHDHVDFEFQHCLLRYKDPRRFGAILWLGEAPLECPLLSILGPEPLSEEFTAEMLYEQAKNRKISVKQFIMEQKVVTGVGNIYATEALFSAKISPIRAANNISLKRYQLLVISIKKILEEAVKQGGTTLKDFVGGDGKPGYFQQTLHVYGKTGELCPGCDKPLTSVKLAARNSVYCSHCQH